MRLSTHSDNVTDINEYISTMQTLIHDGCVAFRGQCNASWSLEPGIIRRIKNTYEGIGQSGLLFSLSVDAVCALLDRARDSDNFDESDCDLNVLAILQHFGAATPLLDFTYDPLIALYFACQASDENHRGTDGKVFCLNYSKQMMSTTSRMRPITDPTVIYIKDALGPEHRGIWYWETPDGLLYRRIARQRSVFVFGWGLYWRYDTDCLVDELTAITICADHKERILRELSDRYGISESTLFPDVYGFARANSCEKLIRNFSAEEFFQKGEDHYWDGSPGWAAEYYKMAFTRKPNWIEARCQYAKSMDQLGEQPNAIAFIEQSMEEVGKDWRFLACKAKFEYKMGQEWNGDLKEARALAKEAGEDDQCEGFIYDLGILDPDET